MNRRAFIASLGSAVACPASVRAQQTERVRRIGYLGPGFAVPEISDLFTEALRQLGWTDGKNISIVFRQGENDPAKLARFAAELANLNVDVIVAAGTLGPLAAKRATGTIPIVMSNAGDPLGSGLVASLARPGGNVTGMSLMAPDLGGKRLELLRELIPELSRVAVLWNAANPYPGIVFRETENAGRQLGLDIRSFEVRSPGDIENALEAAMRQSPGALVTVEDPLTVNYRNQIATFAANAKLPAIYGLREFVRAGGLISYGAQLADLSRRAAVYVDRILKGAKPSDLPVQQPTKFEMLINLRAAKTIGLEVPPTLLARADEVIE